MGFHHKLSQEHSPSLVSGCAILTSHLWLSLLYFRITHTRLGGSGMEIVDPYISFSECRSYTASPQPPPLPARKVRRAEWFLFLCTYHPTPQHWSALPSSCKHTSISSYQSSSLTPSCSHRPISLTFSERDGYILPNIHAPLLGYRGVAGKGAPSCNPWSLGAWGLIPADGM